MPKDLWQPSWAEKAALGPLEATFYSGLSFVGDRFGDLANNVELDGYEKIDLGVVVEHPSGVFFRVVGDNVTESEGLTEGDPRNPTAPNGRPIFGRSVLVSIGYDF